MKPWRYALAFAAAACLFSFSPSMGEDHKSLLAQSYALASRNNHDQAILLAERALKKAEALYGAYDVRLIPILARLAQSYEALNRPAKAKEVQARASNIRRVAMEKATEAANSGNAPAESVAASPSGGAGRARGRGYSSSTRGLGVAPSTEASPSAQAAAASEGQSQLPQFPWPPPTSSTSYVLPRSWFNTLSTLGEVSNGILSALEKSGYVERSFFRTEADGVALVTRLERIGVDGTPVEPRWPTGLAADQFDLVNFLRGLFFVSPGRYRVIVFVMQERPFSQSQDKATEDQAKEWLKTGANALPADIARRSFKDGTCTALIYEFASDGSTVRLVESEIPGLQHLSKAGLVAALEAMNQRR